MFVKVTTVAFGHPDQDVSVLLNLLPQWISWSRQFQMTRVEIGFCASSASAAIKSGNVFHAVGLIFLCAVNVDIKYGERLVQGAAA